MHGCATDSDTKRLPWGMKTRKSGRAAERERRASGKAYVLSGPVRLRGHNGTTHSPEYVTIGTKTDKCPENAQMEWGAEVTEGYFLGSKGRRNAADLRACDVSPGPSRI
ncbi:hypothetical protein F4561_000331 [Lipingzhangella halophila]|uniref:Uncharacterized protein n=1 Tax=Lipingzhangella halophila TaxID=1783352 RepID=A0A7W7RCK2_9ACTN|nr:hypothetical protein [Lipingzhangella halophila]